MSAFTRIRSSRLALRKTEIKHMTFPDDMNWGKVPAGPQEQSTFTGHMTTVQSDKSLLKIEDEFSLTGSTPIYILWSEKVNAYVVSDEPFTENDVNLNAAGA